MLLTEKRLRALIQGILLEGVLEDAAALGAMLKDNPEALRQFQSLSTKAKWVNWLADRYLRQKYPVDDNTLPAVLPLVVKFASKDAAISQKYGSNEQFKTAVDAAFGPPSTRGWTNPADATKMSSLVLNTLLALHDPRVNLGADESWKADKIGEFGKWALYFPTSEKNSVNIAGFDPVTGESYVTWCTARTGGSNLFNLYATQGMMLFYVINEDPRSNPRDPESRISIGFSNGTLEATGRENGITVNGVNKGLTLKDLSRIFGGNLGVNLNSRPMPDDDVDDDQPISVELPEHEHSTFKITGGILGKAHEFVVMHGGTHPIVSEVKAAGSDVEKFDQMLKGLSTSEAADLASYILGHATEAVFKRAAAHKSDKVKGVVARFPGAPLDVLKKLYGDAKVKGDKDMMREFSRNTSVPDVLVDMLKNFFDADDKVKPIDNTEIRVLKEILFNRGLPADVLDEALLSLINNNLAFFNSKLASNIPEIIRDREMNPDTLKLIWDKTDPMLNLALAYHFVEHPSTHSDVLRDIYEGSRFDSNVCARIVKNPNADESTISAIGRDALLRPAFLWSWRGMAARALVDNDLTPVEVLKYIADADVDDRYIHIKTAAEKKLKEKGLQVTESRRMALRIIAELRKAQL